MLKKINAILSFITGIMAIGHTIAEGLILFGVTKPEPGIPIPGIILLSCFTLHVILSLVIVFFKSGNGITYPKLNKATVMQRIMALVLAFFIHTHANNYTSGGALVTPTVLGLITEILFVWSAFAHFNISTDKGLTTLGISKKPLVIVCRLLTIAAFVFALVAIFTYFLGALL